MKFSRKTGAALFVTLFLALGIAATKPTDKPDAERIYKNLKVLPKDIRRQTWTRSWTISKRLLA